MTETRIVKIEGKQDVLFTGKAENMEWTVVPKAFSSISISIGDFIQCYLLHDNDKDEFYLEQIPHREKATKQEWVQQEENYL